MKMMAAVLGESEASRVLLYSALKGRRAGVGVEVRIDYARLHHRIPYGLYNSCRVPNHDESFSVESPPMMRRAKIVMEDLRVTWAVACACGCASRDAIYGSKPASSNNGAPS